jgi:thioredoxin 1
MAGKNVLEFTAENFQQEVLNSAVPVVVDFWATWCGPCLMIGPHIDALADEYAGKVKVGKVNIDDQQDLATQYRISSIPQVFIFKGGKPVQQLAGAQARAAYKNAVESALKS